MAPLKLWLGFDDLVDHFEVFAVHMEERGCLPVSFFFFFFFLNMFSSIFLLYSFHFLIGTFRVGGISYSEALYLTPWVNLLSFEEQHTRFPHC